MGKKEKKFINLSQVDHKLQFISVIAVIKDISPIINRGKLTRIELCLSDHTENKTGFTVKLNFEKEMLSQFLNVAKRGFIVQLKDIKVTKNEGDVYGEVKEEEEITLFNDSHHIHKWYPGEKSVAVDDSAKQKILDIIKWKKENFKHITSLPDSEEETNERNKLKTRRNGLVSDEKDQPSSKTRGIMSISNSTVAKNKVKKISEINQKAMDKSYVEKENKQKNSPSRKSQVGGISTPKNKPFKFLRESKSSISSEEAASSMNATITSSSSRPTRVSSLSNLNNSVSLSKLKKSESLVSLSKLKKSKSPMILGNPKISSSKGKMAVVDKNEVTEKEPSTRLKRSVGPTKTNISSSNTSNKEIKTVNMNSPSLLNVSESPKGKKQTEKDENKSALTLKRAQDKHDLLPVNTSKISLRNRPPEHNDLKNVPLSIEESKKVLNSKTEVSFSKKRKYAKEEKEVVDKKCIFEEKNGETAKRTRQSKTTAEETSDFDETVSPMRNESSHSTPTTASDLNKPEKSISKSKELRERKSLKMNKIVINNQLENNISSKKLIKPQKRADSSTETPLRKKPIIAFGNEHSPESNSDTSHKFKPALVHSGKNRFLNSSDSTLSSDYSNDTSNRSPSPRGSLRLKKRECQKVNISSTPGPMKKIKLDLEIVSNKNQVPKSEKDVNYKQVLVKNGSKTVEGVSSEVTTTPTTNNQVVGNSKHNEDVVNKRTRNTSNCNIKKNDKVTSDTGIFDMYLQPLTKSRDFFAVQNVTDISLCNLEEATDCPDKVDFQCKVVSEFVLVEEGIQVVRVQDGTVCKYGTLRIPQCQSWDTVIKTIMANPDVEEKSPYVDVIVFNYFRLDKPLKVDEFIQINNVLAINLRLLHDPRPPKKECELFFCVEGQNANVKKLKTQEIKELNERIEAEFEKRFPKSAKQKFQSCSKKDVESSAPKQAPLLMKSVATESETQHNKRKLKNCDADVDAKKVKSLRNSPAKINSKKVNPIPETDTVKVDVCESSEVIKNISNSSEETLIEETPTLLREIREIMAEESELGLPVTGTEDVHLKNSGSDVTFSQFCEGAKLKVKNFRTSTQTTNTVTNSQIEIKSQDSIEHDPGKNKMILPEDSSKMEPLIYYPSSSSASSAVRGSPIKGRTSQETQNSQLSASILQANTITTVSNLKPSESPCDDSKSDLSANSSSVKVLSSSGSIETSLKALDGENSSQNISKNEVVDIEVQRSNSPESIELLSDLPEKNLLSESYLISKEKESGRKCILDNSLKKTTTNEEIEVISDNSSIASLLATGDDTTIRPNNTVYNASVASPSDEINPHSSKQFVESIPDRCFYKSPTAENTPIEQELNEVYENEHSPVKYLSYVTLRHLPTLTMDIIEKIQRKNSLTMTVTFTNISPSMADSWQESCFKARCPSCDKLYDVYNAANGKNIDISSPSSAIAVGSHIVCPDSQCCNPILDNPEFEFSLELNLQDGTPVTALLGGKKAEEFFGCSAQEAIRNKSSLNRVAGILERIINCIIDKRPTKVVVTRENICNPKSGPLYLTHVQL